MHKNRIILIAKVSFRCGLVICTFKNAIAIHSVHALGFSQLHWDAFAYVRLHWTNAVYERDSNQLKSAYYSAFSSCILQLVCALVVVVWVNQSFAWVRVCKCHEGEHLSAVYSGLGWSETWDLRCGRHINEIAGVSGVGSHAGQCPCVPQD